MRRVPEEYEIFLNASDTRAMIYWLTLCVDHRYLVDAIPFGEWLAWFKDHLAYLRSEENAVALRRIHHTHFKIMLVALWCTAYYAPDYFSGGTVTWTRHLYDTVAESLDVELV